MINGVPRYLVTGRNRSGSWQIRGEQLGAAIGADAVLRASKVKGYDLAIVIKRPPADLLTRLRMAHVPIVWDIVDAWPQPDGNSWGKSSCVEWLRSELEAVNPQAIVASTSRMAVDVIEAGAKVPVLWLQHHARPNQEVNPIRQRVMTIGYEGGEQYLGERRTWLETECARRGWNFVINPPSLSQLDIIVAFRHLIGYAATHWKSNVKLANAQGTGTPCVLAREAGYEETASGAELWADTPQELREALDTLAPYAVRKERSQKLLAAAPTLDVIASRYRTWLGHLKF